MENIDKELYDKMDLYDKIIGSCMVNTYSISKDNRIILKDFDKNSDIHMFEFEVAKIVSNIYQNRIIYMDMPFFQYLIFKCKHRKESKIKRIAHKKAMDNEFDIETRLKFVADSYKIEMNVFKDIYRLYWKEPTNVENLY